MADKERTRLKRLLTIETERQQVWRNDKVYEVDPKDGTEKYFVTFPYPYMNGPLHLGHAFSMSKAEFAARFQRMQGRTAVFPFGLHVSGMPIVGASYKLKREIANGLLEQDDEEAAEEAAAAAAAAAPAEAKADSHVTGQFKSKKGKKNTSSTQVKIMRSLGIPDEEIPRFEDPAYWLDYFPPRGLKSLERLGVGYDQRRTFITTEANPWYDRFIRWQFNLLRQHNHISFGKRWTVYSPLMNQPCADHDREAGEGINPQEYTLVKLRVLEPLEFPALAQHKDIIGNAAVVLPCATLRPETMYGQTNAWISPTGQYGAYRVAEGEIFITAPRSAHNLAWQGHALEENPREPPTPLFMIEGRDLIGIPLKAPFTPYERIYALPMESVKLNKGTGVVTSVPADSPDDYVNFMQLKSKREWREKEYGIKPEWIDPFEIITVLRIPGMGDHAAAHVCAEMKIQGPKDAEKLEAAKKIVYLKGFSEGKMVAPQAPHIDGKPVAEVKRLMADELIKAGEAITYAEPDGRVVSRSGEECVVTLCNQWFLHYGQDRWRDAVAAHIDGTAPTSSVAGTGMSFFNPNTAQAFKGALDWLGEWPCSRGLGLGTRLPWDNNVLIDSLSDSTIYMAYYTIVPYLQAAGDLSGTGPSPSGCTPSQFGDPVWDFIFRKDDTGIARQAALAEEKQDPSLAPPPEALLLKMRAEFEYWYPMDLRVSGKDLIPNHLTMCLYNHAAVWGPAMMPKAFYCNGHILVDGDKMSKAKGNFIVIDDAIEKYGADGVRLTCAESGDGIDDANFNTAAADTVVLTLTKELDFVEDVVARAATFREGERSFFDLVFLAAMDVAIVEAKNHFTAMCFRAGTQAGFRALLAARDAYRKACYPEKSLANVAALGYHREVILRFCEVLALVSCPIMPHWADHIWANVLGKEGLAVTTRWPEPSTGTGHPDYKMAMARSILQDAVDSFRREIPKLVKTLKGAAVTGYDVYVSTDYAPWQLAALDYARKSWAEKGTIERNQAALLEMHPDIKADAKFALPFLAWLTTQLARAGISSPAEDFDGFVAALLGDTPLVDVDAIFRTPAVTAFLATELGVPLEQINIIATAVGSEAAATPRGKTAKVFQPAIGLATA